MKYRSLCFIVILLLAGGVIWSAEDTQTVSAEPAQNGGAKTLSLVKWDISPPLRDIEYVERDERRIKIFRDPNLPEQGFPLPDGWQGKVGTRFSPHVMQKSEGRAAIPTPSVNVEALGYGMPGFNLIGAPPDTTGGVGLNYYIQWVNTSFAVFHKDDGSMVDINDDSQVNDWRTGNTLWDGFGGRCENSNDGDPIALYDQLADRWVLTQFGLSSSGTGPHSQCIAVSTTDDPLGTWVRAEYVWPSNYLNDYPKLSVWNDGYYLSVNQFACQANWSCSGRGGAAAVFDRENLLQGIQPRDTQYFNLQGIAANMLPVDLDGNLEPPANSPAYFVMASDPADELRIWEVFIDWNNAANSTFGDVGNNPSSTIDVTAFSTTPDITQPGSFNLDSLSPRLMFRAAYRNFDDHESMVLTHAVGDPAGMRWYEVRDPGGASPVLYQEGTYQPDTDERWMGAISMDNGGNIALGYSVSSSTTSPSIRATGRLAGDPLGTMTFSELEIASGAGFQIGFAGQRNRWGDYSTMSIDPADDCTFWYTQEYIQGAGYYVWRTRVAGFKFDECEPLDTDHIFSDGFESGDDGAW